MPPRHGQTIPDPFTPLLTAAERLRLEIQSLKIARPEVPGESFAHQMHVERAYTQGWRARRAGGGAGDGSLRQSMKDRSASIRAAFEAGWSDAGRVSAPTVPVAAAEATQAA